jgi:HK97 family phage major capsid protein
MPRPIEDLIEQIGTQNQETLNGIRAELSDIEQRLARRGGPGDGVSNSIGHQFTHAKAGDLANVEQTRGRTSLEVRAALTTSTADADGSAGGMVVPARDRLVGIPQQRLLIRNLLQVIRVDSGGSVEYAEQTGRTNNAAPVAETVKKPESSLQFDLKTVPLRVLAHFVKASRQILSDAPQLQGLIDSELLYGLALEEEQQILYGSGSGQDLEGIVPQATAYADTLGLTTPNEIDTIGSALHQANLTLVPPDGIVLHPSDWWKMRLLKDGDGQYILGRPMEAVTPNFFGIPVVVTPSMQVGNFLVGSFGQQTLYDRWTARVEVGFENDDFTKNMVTVLAEERVGLAVKRPEALVYGAFA